MAAHGKRGRPKRGYRTVQRTYRVPLRVDVVLRRTAKLIGVEHTELLVVMLERGLVCRR